jgi:hypothetical protein
MKIVSRRVDNVPAGEQQLVSKDKKILSFYNHPPQDELSLEEFERFACARLNLLRKIEQSFTKYSDSTSSHELHSKIDEVFSFPHLQ